MIYNPASTPLLRQAASLGIPCTNGLTMLVHQGAKSLEIWSGIPVVKVDNESLHGFYRTAGYL